MALEFDIRKYKDDGQIIVDGSDALANQAQQVISFQNVRNEQDVFFKAFITAFNETYTPSFNATEVFGRVDPIQQYKGTTRNITLAWKLPAASESEAYENLGRVQKLLLMLYPSYLDLDPGMNPNALTLSEAPLVRLKVMNLLTSHPGNNFETDEEYDENSEKFRNINEPNTSNQLLRYRSDSNSSLGMLGVITSCNVNHNLEGVDGVFQRVDSLDFGVPEAIPNTILPKLIDVNISFTPLHEFTPNSETTPIFPYGVKLGKTDVKKRTVEQGKTLEELREIKKTLEEKRRAAASAQQLIDKKQAQLQKTVNRFMNAREGSRREERLESKGRILAAQIERQSEITEEFNSYSEEFEDLI